MGYKMVLLLGMAIFTLAITAGESGAYYTDQVDIHTSFTASGDFSASSPVTPMPFMAVQQNVSQQINTGDVVGASEEIAPVAEFVLPAILESVVHSASAEEVVAQQEPVIQETVAPVETDITTELVE